MAIKQMCDEFDSPWKRFRGIAEAKYRKLKEPILFGYESRFIPVLKINLNLPVCGVSIYFLNPEATRYHVETLLDEWKRIGAFNRHLVERPIVNAPPHRTVFSSLSARKQPPNLT